MDTFELAKALQLVANDDDVTMHVAELCRIASFRLSDLNSRATRSTSNAILLTGQVMELRESLASLVDAIERDGDWSEETRVGMALKRAEAVLNLQDPVGKNG